MAIQAVRSGSYGGHAGNIGGCIDVKGVMVILMGDRMQQTTAY